MQYHPRSLRSFLARLVGTRIGGDPLKLGLCGILLVFLTFGALNALVIPKFAPLDEPRHAAYALLLAEGKLPKVSEPLPHKKLGIRPLRKSNIVAAANHPPLYYLLVGLPLKWGSVTNHMATGLQIARLITLGLAAAGLVYVFRIVRLLLPAYPAVALTATALTAVMPAFVNVCALVHNDALAFLAAGGLLHAALRVLVDGLSRGPLIAAAIWASVACLTRFASLLVLAPALLAVFVAPLLHEQGSAARRLGRGALACGAILGAAVLTSGWFYLRNYWLYGDLTGGKELFEILHRRARKPAIYYVFSFEQWLTLHDHLWARLAAGKVMKGATVYVGRCFSLIALVGFAKAIFDARRHLRRSLWRDPRAVALAISLLSFLCVTLPIFEFYSRGGGITARYFFPVLWVPMTILAVGLHAVKTPALPAAGVLMASLLSVATLYLYFLLLVKTLWAEGFGYFMAFAGAALGLVLLLDPVRALHRRIGDAAAEPQQDAAVAGGAARPTSALPGGAARPTSDLPGGAAQSTSALPGGAAQPTSDAPPPGESAAVSP